MKAIYVVAGLLCCLTACERNDSLAPDLKAASSGGPAVNAPSNAVATTVSTTEIDVVWQDNASNENGFELERSTTGPGGPFSLLTRLGVNLTTYSNSGLAPSTQYCYAVRAFRVTGNKTNYSALSNVACATTLTPPPPPPPAAPTGTFASPLGSTVLEVSWFDYSTQDGFRIERSLDAGGSWTVAGTAGPDPWGVFSDYGRTSDVTVCYRVTAYNVSGESAPSDMACSTPPAAPTGLFVASVDPIALTATLAWTDNSAIEDGYEIVTCYYDCTPLVDLPANTTTADVACDGSYYYVVALKDGGQSDATDVILADCSSVPLGAAPHPAPPARTLRRHPRRHSPGRGAP